MAHNPSPPSSLSLKRLEEAVSACNRCGFCTSYCPTYLATGSEAHSPRGRNQMFRALLDGRIKNMDEALNAVDTCLLCGECTTVCFSEVPTADLMVQARAMINERKGVPAPIQWFLIHVLPHPTRFKWFLKLAFLAKNIGLSWVIKKSGLLEKWAPEIAAADELVEKLPLRFFVERKEVRPYLSPKYHDTQVNLLKSQMNQDRQKKASVATSPTAILNPNLTRVAYFPPCGSNYLRPEIGMATLTVLRSMALTPIIPDLICCGLPAASTGVLDRVREMAKENIERLEGQGYDHILVDDSSCAAHMKDYPKYFTSDPIWLPRAQAISLKVRELSTFLVNQGLPALLSKKTWTGGAVAYHDPCKAQYAQKTKDTPRELLNAVRGLKVIPVVDADQCCGGGGTYSFMQPEISRAVLAAKVKNLAATGAKIVVTSSASCLMQVAYGLRKDHPTVQVLHLSEFLVRALQK